MALIDLENLTPDAIEQLKAVLGSSGGNGRTPIRKPLTNLNPPNTAKGRLNRPHFEWSAEDDGQTVIAPFPCLRWDENGVERRIETLEELQRVPETWTAAPPMAMAAADPMDKLREEFDALSPEDQAFVIEAQKKARLERLHGLMAGISEKDVASLTVKPIEAKRQKGAA